MVGEKKMENRNIGWQIEKVLYFGGRVMDFFFLKVILPQEFLGEKIETQ